MITSGNNPNDNHNKTNETIAPDPLYKGMDQGLFRHFYPLLFLLSALFIPKIAGQLMLLVPLLILLVLVTPRDRRGRQFVRCAVVSLFILLGTVALLFVRADGASDILLSGLGWSVTRGSLDAFILISLRCFNAFLSVLILVTIMPIYSVMHRLRALRVPALFVELSELTYRYINILEETAYHIFTAQRSRLAYEGISQRLSHSGMLFAQTFVLAHNDAEHVYNGLLSRGYDDATEDTRETEGPETVSGSAAEVIRLEGVSFGYEKGKDALRSIDLSVHRGERIALLGENGAGKSTLFRLLNGIHTAHTGCYYANGRAMDGRRASTRSLRRQVGIVFQNPNHQLFTPSVGDEIAFGLRNIGVRGEELNRRVDKVLRDFALEDNIGTPPHLLSEGQKKWVAIASVLAMEPDVILLDEPTAGLDRYYTERVLGLLDTLHRAGKTLILSTHDMEFAYRWADRGIILHEGAIIADDTIERIFADTMTLQRANLTPPLTTSRISCAADRAIDDEMASLPIFLPVHAHRALIIGGGKGAYRKALTLHQCGIAFDVIAPELCSEMSTLIAQTEAQYTPRHHVRGDIWRHTLVIAATGNATVDLYITEECIERHIPVNNLSDPTAGTFLMGATSIRKGTTFAIQTKYKLPEISQVLRDRYDAFVDRHVEVDRLEELGRIRQAMIDARERGADEEYRELQERYNVARQDIISRL